MNPKPNPHPEALPVPHHESEPKLAAWRLLVLLLPFAGLLFPGLYARLEPRLFGFPFFYWYQFVWIFLSVACTATAYLGTRRR